MKSKIQGNKIWKKKNSFSNEKSFGKSESGRPSGSKKNVSKQSVSTKNVSKKDKQEGGEKKVSKSAKFWKLQSEKAAAKKKKVADDQEFQVVPKETIGAHFKQDESTESTDQDDEDLASSFLEEKTLDVQDHNEQDDSEENESVEDESAQEEEDDDQENEEEEEEDDDDQENDEEAEEEDYEGEQNEAKSQIKSANRKGKKSGGFQSMGLSFPVFKAIQHLGYKIPTPIQRKSIPLIIEGGDVVAMARTGSGKTASFLIPMIEKLKAHSAKVGVRGLILSPSRELATQTHKFARDLAKYTDLRIAVFVGGENMDSQFSAIASNPDIIIATPGRLMHLIIESNLEMKCVDYLVFDEADRLFEMGFAEQLREIVSRIPPSRQTVLFSATLPKILVDFARAGLQNPSLIRLDVDTKISRDLQMYFFQCKTENKDGALIYLLTQTIPKDQQTVVFVATKHHVEYVNQLLLANGLSSTFIYGTLDPTARKIHLARFRHNKCKVLVVTDVAARGIDVPLLDNVINYNFPASSKIFVHRVGRTARAGKSGCSWSLVSTDEVPYMLDLQLFTGRPLIYASLSQNPDYTTQLVYGTLPSSISLVNESVALQVKGNLQLETMASSVRQGTMMYLRSRPSATKASHSRSKEISGHSIGLHPLFASLQSEAEKVQRDMVSAISKFRPQESVFEIGKKGKTSAEALLMQKRRSMFHSTILRKKTLVDEQSNSEMERQKKAIDQSQREWQQETAGDADFEGFNDVSKKDKKEKRAGGKDKEFYLSYRPTDDHTEAGYAVHDASFNAQASKAAMELIPDEDLLRNKKKAAQTWDSKKHRFTSSQIGGDNKKRVRTENGTLVPATFQSDRFEKWQKRTKVDIPRAGERELAGAAEMAQNSHAGRFRHNNVTAPKLDSKSFKRKMDAQETKWRKEGLKGKDFQNAKDEWLESKKSMGPTATATSGPKRTKGELKGAHQIAKEREALDKRRAKTGRHAKRGGKGFKSRR